MTLNAQLKNSCWRFPEQFLQNLKLKEIKLPLINGNNQPFINDAMKVGGGDGGEIIL